MKPLFFNQQINLGSDPEIFLSLGGKTIGSEKVIAKEGLSTSGGKLIRDGVQIELNPSFSNCRQSCCYSISLCFKELSQNLRINHPNVILDFAPVVKVDKEEFKSLSAESQVFGCQPSTNIYQEDSKIKVNPKRYMKRSGGGHLHFSTYGGNHAAISTPSRLVPVFDAILGNTCVLIDRDKSNVERRKVYGKSGEFRAKSTERIEYRTLSNFWLKSSQLASLVMGLGRMAIHLTEQSTDGNDYLKAIRETVSQDDIVKAINHNDFELAYKNFEKLTPIILEAAGNNTNSYPINQLNIKEFHHFVKLGMDYWFKEHPLTYWCEKYTGQGWEHFMSTNVKQDIESNRKSLPEKTLREIWI